LACPAKPLPHGDHGGVEGWIRITAPDVVGVYTLRVRFLKQSSHQASEVIISIPLIVR